MINHIEVAKQTANLLLQIKAIKLNSENYFQWASGWNSPIYCDNRLILSFPVIRNYIKEQLVKIIEDKYGKPDVIAGVATGAIGMGMLIADEMGLPFVYVRPEPKKHGRKNQVEGFIEKGANVVVIEDLVSTGNSSLIAVEALREMDVNVKGMLAVFTYGFQLAKDNFEKANVELITLSNYQYLIDEALKKGYINEKELDTLKDWVKAPDLWKKV
jgi:orotate phosphoribosyltransferase